MEKLLKKLPENVRQTVLTTAPLVIVVILFVIVGNFGVGKILGIRSQITSAEKDQATLDQKLKLLQSLSTTVSKGAVVAASALPDSNSSLVVISQLKTLGMASGVILSGIKSNVSASALTGMSEGDISFSADGTRSQIIDFVKNTGKLAPIVIVDKIKIMESGGLVRANISVKTFWASFPKTIPPITQPITDLTASEKQILTEITGLVQPAFFQVAPTQSGDNTAPFGQ